MRSYYVALVYAGLREKDHAFEWLERADQERSTVACVEAGARG